MRDLKVVRPRGNVLKVKGLDAWDDTPVLDIKPYTKRESIKNYRMPHWVKLLDRQETDRLRKYAT
jgi:tRNA (Thr-GGU) A37 N-methylase